MEEFIKLVSAMREAQLNYFRARKKQNVKDADHYLIESKRFEREVDEFIERFQKNQREPSLF